MWRRDVTESRELPPIDECIITTDYAPVCGADGETYPNLSAATCELVRQQFNVLAYYLLLKDTNR